ncbi:hypothetical protein Tco_1473211, partial [Tanacetum coccineum]
MLVLDTIAARLVLGTIAAELVLDKISADALVTELDSSMMKSWQLMQLDLSNIAYSIVLHLHELHVVEGEHPSDQSL